MINNGLKPLGKYLSRENSEQIKHWYENTLSSRKLVKSALFCVLTIDSEWLQKGYINSTAEISFDNEHQAIEYIENWNKTHKGIAKLITPK